MTRGKTSPDLPPATGHRSPATAFLSLGSNLGDRRANLSEAIAALTAEGISVAAVSPVYETAAVGVGDQPDFLNQVIRVETGLSPFGLLRAIKQIELAMGRPLLSHGKPRRIDIDLLLYDDLWVVALDLLVPHPEMWRRKFVLLPLLDLGSDPASPSSERASAILKKPEVAAQRVKRV